jgi:hypothetical protein
MDFSVRIRRAPHVDLNSDLSKDISYSIAPDRAAGHGQRMGENEREI